MDEVVDAGPAFRYRYVASIVAVGQPDAELVQEFLR
jgi:hypothetical protein